jgi:hypothetical protein
MELKMSEPYLCVSESTGASINESGQGDLAPIDLTGNGNIESLNGSVRLNLEAAGLSFQMHTEVPQNLQAIELNAQLQLALAQLKETQDKLENAWCRIGFLEAQLNPMRLKRQETSLLLFVRKVLRF